MLATNFRARAYARRPSCGAEDSYDEGEVSTTLGSSCDGYCSDLDPVIPRDSSSASFEDAKEILGVIKVEQTFSNTGWQCRGSGKTVGRQRGSRQRFSQGSK